MEFEMSAFWLVPTVAGLMFLPELMARLFCRFCTWKRWCVPCPFCSDMNHAVRIVCPSDDPELTHAVVCIECKSCGTRGPAVNAELEPKTSGDAIGNAMARWNKRT